MAEQFENFTTGARKVLTYAVEEAHRFNHNYIGTEHLLLGVVREGDGVAARVLADMGVDLPKVRGAIAHIIGRGDKMVAGEIGLTPRAKKVIELAVDEARRLNHHYIDTEHLLLGMIREGEGIAAGVLESMGVNLDRVRQAVIQVVSQGGEPPEELLPARPALPRFGELRRVLAVHESQTVDDVEATILSLELYERRTVLHIRLRRLPANDSTESRRWQGHVAISIADDSGRLLPRSPHFSGHPAADASFMTVRYTEAINEQVRRVLVTIDGGPDPNHDPMPPEQSVTRASCDPAHRSKAESPPGVRRWEFEIEL